MQLLLIVLPFQLPPNLRRSKDTSSTISHVLEELDEWSLRAFMVDIKLMYHRLEERKSDWVEDVSRCIVDSFQLGENESEEEEEPRAKRARLDKKKSSKSAGPIWMVAHLVKHLKFLQPKILRVSAHQLEKQNWCRSSKVRVSRGHQPFLQLILMCLKEADHSEKDRVISREEREHEKENLLQSLHNQLSTFLCFNSDEKLYNYEDFTARKTMQDALKLRFSLVGGLFESITTTFQSIQDWSFLLVQLIVRGVIDLTNNSDLFTMVIDMINILIHTTLIREKESGGSERDEDNRRMYQALVKKLKKEIGDKQNPSIRQLRQLLPIPKCVEEVMVTEQYGLVPDAKGNKVRGFNCDKKQGLQVAEKQKVSPWDILEGHKNPAPLSWNMFQAIKTERKPLKYEEAFQNMKYMKNTLLKPASYYLEDPPLPQEDLEPTKDSKEDEKNVKKEELDLQINGKRGAKGMRRGQNRMSPGPLNSGGQGGGLYPGNINSGQGNMYGPQQHNNTAYMGNNMAGQQGMGAPPGHMGHQMGYNQQSSMSYGGAAGQTGGPGGNFAPGGGMQNMPGQGYSGNQAAGMMPGSSNSKMALQNMLRARMPGPGQGQFVGNPGGQMGQMIRGPGGQFGGNMMPGGHRQMYPGGNMSNMNSGYGMQGGQQPNYGGFGGGGQMRMNTPSQGMGGIRPSGQYGGMGGMNQGGMSNMSMSRSGMMGSGGPGAGYGAMQGQGRQAGYGGMQGGMQNMGPAGAMMGPQTMRPMGPGMMGPGAGGMNMQGQGMGMQSGGMQGMQGMMGGNMQGGSQLMAHLQRGGQNMGGYQQNRF